MSLLHGEEEIDQATAIVLKKKLAQDFRDQLRQGEKITLTSFSVVV